MVIWKLKTKAKKLKSGFLLVPETKVRADVRTHRRPI